MERHVSAVLSKLGLSSSPTDMAAHDYYNVYRKTRSRLEELLAGEPPADWRILDAGCGYNYPLVALLNGEVDEICGLDLSPVFFRDGRLGTFRQTLISGGVLRAAKRAGPMYSVYQRYYRILTGLSGRTIDHSALPLYTYDGRHFPFADEHFDAIVSNAVVEQVSDLDSFASECARVLRNDGIADILWHNYYSPSGAYRHAAEVARSPWGHLIGASRPSPLLNRKRPEEVRDAFAAQFTILRMVGADIEHVLSDEEGFEPEGRDQLDKNWRRRLSEYPQDLLTTRSFLLQAKRD